MSGWRKHPKIDGLWQHPALGEIRLVFVDVGKSLTRDPARQMRYDWTDASGVYRQRFDTLRIAQLMARRVSRPTREAEFV